MRKSRILRDTTTYEEAIQIYAKLMLLERDLLDAVSIGNSIKTYVSEYDKLRKISMNTVMIQRIRVMDDLHDRGFEIPDWCDTENKNLRKDYQNRYSIEMKCDQKK